MKQAIFFILIVMSHLSFAQKKTYYDIQGNITGKKKAAFYEVVSKVEDKLWETQRYYISGKLKYEGNSIKKDGSKKVGVHNTYDSIGVLRKKSLFIDGKRSVTETFYSSTNLKRKSVYNNKLISSVHEYYDSGQLKNEVIFSGPKEERELKAKSYFENGSLKRDDEYVKTLADGEIKYELIKGLSLSEEGKEISHTPFMRVPQFPGGLKALKQYLSENTIYSKDARKLKIEGQVVVKFVVNTNGEIEKTNIVKSVYYSLDEEALRVINNMPNWMPGIAFGEIVNAPLALPINFRLSSY